MQIRYTRCLVEFVPGLYNIIDTNIKFTHYFNCEKCIFTKQTFNLINWVCIDPSVFCYYLYTVIIFTLKK